MKKKLLLIGFLIYLSRPVPPASAIEPLTLGDCLQLAFKNSKLLKVAELNAVTAREKAAETRAQKYPWLAVNAAYTRVGKVTSFTVPMGPGGASQKFSFGTPNRINLDVRMQMAVYSWGRIGNTVALSQKSTMLLDEQEKQERLNVTDQVLRAYHAVLLNADIVHLHKTSVGRAEKYQAVVGKRYDHGQASKLDFLRAQVQLKNAASSLAEAKNNLKKSYLFLAKVVGAADSAVSVTGTLQYLPFAIHEQSFLQTAWNNRVELRLLAVQQEMSKNSLQIAKTGNKPNLNAFSSYNVQNGFDPMDPERFVDNWNVGMQLSVPLFDGFASKHKVQQSRIEMEKIRLQEKEMRDWVGLQIKQAIITLNQSEEKIIAMRENITLAREALSIAEVQYEYGVISSLDVIDAEQTCNQNELFYEQAIFNHVMAKLELCKILADYRAFSDVMPQ